jgi:hypothetical protein
LYLGLIVLAGLPSGLPPDFSLEGTTLQIFIPLLRPCFGFSTPIRAPN